MNKHRSNVTDFEWNKLCINMLPIDVLFEFMVRRYDAQAQPALLKNLQGFLCAALLAHQRKHLDSTVISIHEIFRCTPVLLVADQRAGQRRGLQSAEWNFPWKMNRNRRQSNDVPRSSLFPLSGPERGEPRFEPVLLHLMHRPMMYANLCCNQRIRI